MATTKIPSTRQKLARLKPARLLAPGDDITGYAGLCRVKEIGEETVNGAVHKIVWCRLTDPSVAGGFRYISRLYEFNEMVEVLP
jgi:hypothetical protein